MEPEDLGEDFNECFLSAFYKEKNVVVADVRKGKGNTPQHVNIKRENVLYVFGVLSWLMA